MATAQKAFHFKIEISCVLSSSRLYFLSPAHTTCSKDALDFAPEKKHSNTSVCYFKMRSFESPSRSYLKTANTHSLCHMFTAEFNKTSEFSVKRLFEEERVKSPHLSQTERGAKDREQPCEASASRSVL